MMWRAKWGRNHNPGGQPRSRMNKRCSDCGIAYKRWQQSGQAIREHGFARARWTKQQDVMSTGRGNFECKARDWLTFDIGQVHS